MPTLSQYTNVYNTAVALLRKKGFQVWRDEGQRYWAERDGWDFLADDPVGLLGLVAIFEARCPPEWTEYWWRDAEASYAHRNLPAAPARPYEPVYVRARSG
jgi:hypothetical protein